MNRSFYVIWAHPDVDIGDGWDGPYENTDAAKASVPDGATASLLVVPLAALTPAEQREALPILERRVTA